MRKSLKTALYSTLFAATALSTGSATTAATATKAMKEKQLFEYVTGTQLQTSNGKMNQKVLGKVWQESNVILQNVGSKILETRLNIMDSNKKKIVSISGTLTNHDGYCNSVVYNLTPEQLEIMTPENIKTGKTIVSVIGYDSHTVNRKNQSASFYLGKGTTKTVQLPSGPETVTEYTQKASAPTPQKEDKEDLEAKVEPSQNYYITDKPFYETPDGLKECLTPKTAQGHFAALPPLTKTTEQEYVKSDAELQAEQNAANTAPAPLTPVPSVGYESNTAYTANAPTTTELAPSSPTSLETLANKQAEDARLAEEARIAEAKKLEDARKLEESNKAEALKAATAQGTTPAYIYEDQQKLIDRQKAEQKKADERAAYEDLRFIKKLSVETQYAVSETTGPEVKVGLRYQIPPNILNAESVGLRFGKSVGSGKETSSSAVLHTESNGPLTFNTAAHATVSGNKDIIIEGDMLFRPFKDSDNFLRKFTVGPRFGYASGQFNATGSLVESAYMNGSLVDQATHPLSGSSKFNMFSYGVGLNFDATKNLTFGLTYDKENYSIKNGGVNLLSPTGVPVYKINPNIKNDNFGISATIRF